MEKRKIIVQLQNISKQFGSQKVLKDISLDIYDGEFVTLLGPSGCGKTTILRMIAGFESVDSGDLYLNGQRINNVSPNLRDVKTVFQSYALFPHMTVYENVAFGPSLKKLPKNQVHDLVMDALKMVKLDGFAQRKPAQLSGGQQQRVAIARAVVNKPLVLLLDESLSALDFKLRKEMQIELKQLQRKLGITFVFVTHDQEEALSMSDRVIVLNQGSIEQIGSPREIYEKPKNLFVAKFVGEINILEGAVQNKNGKGYIADVEGTICHLSGERPLQNGEKVKVLLRPEDLRIERNGSHNSSHEAAQEKLLGSVDEIIYKGTTVDLIICLKNGKRILASEFFNEDANNGHEYQHGEEIMVSWEPGWEVILNNE